MSLISLDFESPFGHGVQKNHPLHKYSLRSMTYVKYIMDERFNPFGVGIKIDDGETEWVSRDQTEEAICDTFPDGNDHTLVAHNCMFDGAIISWRYKRRAARYWCTQRMSNAIWAQRSASLEQLCISCYPDDESIRKTPEVLNFANKLELTPEEDEACGNYCINDVDIMFECLRYMWPVLPDDELELLDMTLKMFIHPPFVLDSTRLESFLTKYNTETDEIITASGLPRTTLASPKKFVEYVEGTLGFEIPRIPAPTKKNPDNIKAALGKDELAWVEFKADHPDHDHIWKARQRVASTIARTRAERMLEHAELLDGWLPMPLAYCAAHTKRWGGTDKLNPQNFQRKSEHRKSLMAPEGYKVVVVDLSNIEGRKNAWFCGEERLLKIFRAGGDVYNDFATQVFGYEVDRNMTALDEDGNEYEPQWMEGFVGKQCQLGLGYQTGPLKLKKTLFLLSDGQVDFTLDQCKHIVYDMWRPTYSKIPEMWDTLGYEIIPKMYLLKPGQSESFGPLVIEHERIRLPSGLYLTYPGLRAEEDEHGRPQWEYWNGDYYTNLYGGKLLENIIQALSRITMSDGMLRINRDLTYNLDHWGELARVGLTIHDEVVVLVREHRAKECYDMMVSNMIILPDWCNDGSLVLAAKGGYADNYSK